MFETFSLLIYNVDTWHVTTVVPYSIFSSFETTASFYFESNEKNESRCSENKRTSPPRVLYDRESEVSDRGTTLHTRTCLFRPTCIGFLALDVASPLFGLSLSANPSPLSCLSSFSPLRPMPPTTQGWERVCGHVPTHDAPQSPHSRCIECRSVRIRIDTRPRNFNSATTAFAIESRVNSASVNARNCRFRETKPYECLYSGFRLRFSSPDPALFLFTKYDFFCFSNITFLVLNQYWD